MVELGFTAASEDKVVIVAEVGAGFGWHPNSSEFSLHLSHFEIKINLYSNNDHLNRFTSLPEEGVPKSLKQYFSALNRYTLIALPIDHVNAVVSPGGKFSLNLPPIFPSIRLY